MNRELLQMLGVAAGTLLTLMVADSVPQYRVAIWSFGGAIALGLLYAGLRKPVNYRALRTTECGFEFERLPGLVESAQWTEVVDVYFYRGLDPMTNELETEWEIHTNTNTKIRVLVEWQHRKSFAEAIECHVPGFLVEVAHQALATKEEGRWHCYQAPNPSIERTVSGKPETAAHVER